MTIRKSLFAFITTFILAAVTAGAHADETTSPEAPAASSVGVVNINSADATQLAYLPRVGAKAAQRIVDYRHDHGPFKKTSDLMEVKGFGDKSFNRLAQYLTVDGKTTITAKVRSARSTRSSKSGSKKQSSQAAASPSTATR